MEKVKILVVEDEIIIADNICDNLNSLGYNVLEPVVNFTEAIDSIEKEKPDLAILDIKLSGRKTGVDLARTISEKYNFPFIFLSSNSDKITLDEVKAVEPYAFLVKPFSSDDLYTAIEIALFNFSKRTSTKQKENKLYLETVFIKDKGIYKKINLKEVIYIKSDHIYLEIFFLNSPKSLVRASINDIINKLNNNFIRVHRGFIINIQHLNQISNSNVIVHNNSIPLGRTYRQNLFEKVNII